MVPEVMKNLKQFQPPNNSGEFPLKLTRQGNPSVSVKRSKKSSSGPRFRCLAKANLIALHYSLAKKSFAGLGGLVFINNFERYFAGAFSVDWHNNLAILVFTSSRLKFSGPWASPRFAFRFARRDLLL